MAKVSGIVLRSLRMTSDLASISQKGFERNHRPLVPFRFYSQSQSSTTEQHSSSGTAEKPSVPQRGESTSTSEAKKSRTGGDMTDDGQVQTPSLHKMRSTRDIIQGKGKETEDRLASEKKSA